MSITRLVNRDTQPVILTVTYAVNSQAVDLTGATCTLKLTHRKTTTVSTFTCTLTDPTNGKCQWDPAVGGYVAGEYNAELQITLASGKIRTYPDIADDWILSIRQDPT